MESAIAKNFFIIKEIGKGSFGKVYLAKDCYTHREVAVKIEYEDEIEEYLLKEEYAVYKKLQGGRGIPRVEKLITGNGKLAMSMELLGPSLGKLLFLCGGKFSMKTVMLLADQLLSLLEFLHFKSILHRDIKPENFLMGLGTRRNQVYMIDYGLCSVYQDPVTWKHIPFQTGKHFTGTPKFSSRRHHYGYEQSRRDDLESLGYMLIYFLRGTLPWEGVTGDTATHVNMRVQRIKAGTRIEQLCKGYPEEFNTYFTYCKDMLFDENPDYIYMRQILRKILYRNNHTYDNDFDWCKLKLDCFKLTPEEENEKNENLTYYLRPKPHQTCAIQNVLNNLFSKLKINKNTNSRYRR